MGAGVEERLLTLIAGSMRSERHWVSAQWFGLGHGDPFVWVPALRGGEVSKRFAAGQIFTVCRSKGRFLTYGQALWPRGGRFIARGDPKDIF